ncbi:Putative auto-transporter adhesin, head GIN domain [Arenibacter nanhaiticus]|uniref:Putative auto-transporter adhesin, head GIN domain n=1 Tax=Arenibacter nanhaiticus TaxID=558155 RepID=A0A1M6E5M6_9FLAO|nr:head GIN domain-containing protein [Arenibacter nanhaiticus]SHI80715.1 Putative auto-transporter adhesin, head GIN domain [Arenibacter nanhaiticus]
MTTLARILISLIIAILISSCGFDLNFGAGKKGNGIITEERRPVQENFTTVTASEGLNVFITQGSDFEILVEADENVLDLIGTDIKNGTLRIHAQENIGKATKKVFVMLPKITALETSSGANMRTKNTITAKNVKLSASSGSRLQIEQLMADDIKAGTSSGASITLGGEVNNLYTKASSGASIDAKNLLSNICQAEASSGANIQINVSSSLEADASSGGHISYTGKAQLTQRKTSSGSVSHF